MNNNIKYQIVVIITAISIGTLIGILTGLTIIDLQDTMYKSKEYDRMTHTKMNGTVDLDSNFYTLCKYFANSHYYNETTYNCVQYSNDFKQFMNIAGYDVSLAHLKYYAKYGHAMNYINTTDGIMYIEPQSCTIYTEKELNLTLKPALIVRD
jgi:hypothetical protein